MSGKWGLHAGFTQLSCSNLNQILIGSYSLIEVYICILRMYIANNKYTAAVFSSTSVCISCTCGHCSVHFFFPLLYPSGIFAGCINLLSLHLISTSFGKAYIKFKYMSWKLKIYVCKMYLKIPTIRPISSHGTMWPWTMAMCWFLSRLWRQTGWLRVINPAMANLFFQYTVTKARE